MPIMHTATRADRGRRGWRFEIDGHGRSPPCVSCARLSVEFRVDRTMPVDFRSQVSCCLFIEGRPWT